MKRNLILILFVFFFSFSISSSSFALKHDITAIPLNSDQIPLGSVSGVGLRNVPFYIRWGNSNFYQSDLRNSAQESAPMFFYPKKSGDDCVYDNYSSSFGSRAFSSTDRNFSFTFPSFNSVYAPYVQNDYAPCRQTSPFGGQGRLAFRDSSIPFGHAYSAYYHNMLPYYYDYSGFYLKDDAIDSNGIHYSYDLKMSDIFGGIPTKFSELQIPLGRSSESVIGELSYGREFKVSGGFRFPGASYGNGFVWSQDFLDHGYFKLRYNVGHKNNIFSQNYSKSVDCNLTTRTIANFSEGTDVYVDFECPFTVDETDFDSNSMYLFLDINYSNSQSNPDTFYIFDTTSDWIFYSAFVVSDNDYTQGANFNEPVSGNLSSQSPGSATNNPLYPDNADWVSSLSNLFSFNVFNPFSNIFALFTDNNNCVSIPILAGLLNSTNTTYCPWFPSSVRNILTPILGISSIMLLFGFVVKWLKSSDEGLLQNNRKGVD